MEIVKNKWVSLAILAAIAIGVIVVSFVIKDKLDEHKKAAAAKLAATKTTTAVTP